MSPEHPGMLRDLPAVGAVVDLIAAAEDVGEHHRPECADLAREVIAGIRADARAGRLEALPETAEIADRVRARLRARRETRIPTMVNATGIILHTGLGRACMPPAAAEAAARVAGRPCCLALDAETGGRGSRDAILEDLIRSLTGAQAATLAGNNAAATLLVLAALAGGREVIVSRGQLIEIGGEFRLPDVMAQSGALMREVGTTNKTHLKDYEKVLTAETGAILHVHLSNYRIVGFHGEPALSELAALGKRRGVPVLHDLGSGALVDLAQFGLDREPLVQEGIRDGADVVFFSGDKLIGGPQCGVIAGSRALIERIRRHPLARAMRVGKMTIAGLEATLRLFLDRERLFKEHPVYRMLSEPTARVRERAERVARALDGRAGLAAASREDAAELGSGGLPGRGIPSWSVSVRHGALDEEALARGLRRLGVAVRREAGRVIADMRTVFDDEEERLVAAFLAAAAG